MIAGLVLVTSWLQLLIACIGLVMALAVWDEWRDRRRRRRERGRRSG